MEPQELPDTKKIVAKWLARSSRIQNRHYDAAATLLRWHYGTGGPLVVLSVIEGSTLLLTLTKQTGMMSPYPAIITGFIGLLVAVLAAMQAFMSFESRSQSHYKAGVKYGAIKRRLEVKISEDNTGEIAAADLKDLRAEWDALTEESPPIPLSIWNKAEKEKTKAKTA